MTKWSCFHGGDPRERTIQQNDCCSGKCKQQLVNVSKTWLHRSDITYTGWPKK